MQQIATFIKMVPLFHELREELLHQVAEALEVRNCETDQVLISQGEIGHELFIVLRGEVIAYVVDGDSQRELRRFQVGEYFGMNNIVTSERSPFTIRCGGDVKAIVVARDLFERMFEDSSSFGRAVCRSLASFLSESIHRLPKFPFRTLAEFPNLASAYRLLPARISTQLQAIAVEHENDRVVVAIVNPNDTRAVQFISDVLSDYRVEFVAVSANDFARNAQDLFASSQALPSLDAADLEDFVFVTSEGMRRPITEGGPEPLVRGLVQAIRSNASDLHIESKEWGGRIRLRVDGSMLPLSDDHSVDEMRHMISRIKVVSGLDITNARRPQDGRFRIEREGHSTEFRISAMPSEQGEKLVLRISDSHKHVDFNRLFLSDEITRFASDIFSQPSGLVLVTGPTGCGKTTTLYSALQMLFQKNPDKNFVTIEDPVEYLLDFATQVRVDDQHGLGFARLLRSVLRQDPDVIFVGEIRDRESAALAVEAATTGHLVLSTLHTHSALETLVRLRNLDVPSYLLADALKGVLSQKLLPRLHASKDEASDQDTFELGRIAMFELLAVTEELSDLVDRAATRAELATALHSDSYLPFEAYGNQLIERDLVAEMHVQRVLPKVPKLGGE